MDFALSVGVYLVGLISGVLVCMAIMSDRTVYADEPTETGVLPRDPVILPMPPVQPTRGRRPF